MRLWHIDLITNGLLPKKQLQSQWRELNSIYKKQDKHILINYIYNYSKDYLCSYSMAVIKEMASRNIKIRDWSKFNKYFQMIDIDNLSLKLKFKEHDKDYLTICYYNLMEKCMRGQKDFTLDVWCKLNEFYKKEMKK